MSKLSYQPLKGMLDDFPEKMAIYNFIKNKIDKIASQLNYHEYDAPVLESLDVYLKKTSAELLQEQSYLFKDRGNRSVLLRPEMTPSMARMVSQIIKTTPLPIRWYALPKCYRYERPQRGRLREFRQCNIDIIGGDKLTTDSEIIFLIHKLMHSFQITPNHYTIFYNHRGWIDFLLKQELFSNQEIQDFYYVVDRKNKLSEEKFNALLENTFIGATSKKKINFIKHYLSSQSPFELLPEEKIDNPDLKSFYEFINIIEKQKWSNVKFAPQIVRGIDYYTGMVFEAFGHSETINRALFGGGRYDNLLEHYGKESVSGIGFGMGIHIFSLFLAELGLLEINSRPVKNSVYLAPLSQKHLSFCLKIAEFLMKEYQIELSSPNSLNSHLKKIQKKKNSFIVVIGEEEEKDEFFKIKNIKTGAIKTIFL